MESPVLNGINGHDPKVKVEDAMDEGQLNRLVTGFTVDATGSSNTAVCGISSNTSACIDQGG
jgi:histone acetyltransferase